MKHAPRNLPLNEKFLKNQHKSYIKVIWLNVGTINIINTLCTNLAITQYTT